MAHHLGHAGHLLGDEQAPEFAHIHTRLGDDTRPGQDKADEERAQLQPHGREPRRHRQHQEAPKVQPQAQDLHSHI